MSLSAIRTSTDTTCGLCASTSAGQHYDLGEHKILRCATCSLMWLSPMPDEEALQEVYGDQYFSNQKFFANTNEGIFGYHDYISERFNRQVSYRAMVKRITGLLEGDHESSLLDIGCGLGYLMDCAHDQGFRVEGVEFNPEAAAQLRRKFVFPVHVGDILTYDGQQHDVITMLDVIEHLTDPIEAVRRIRRNLKDRGLLVLTTMDCDSPMSRLLGTRLEDFRRVREHLYFFTRKSISRLLHDEGFDVISIRYHGHTFRLDFLAQRVALVSPILGRICSSLVKALHIGGLQIHLNPGTKMVIYARKTSAAGAERDSGECPLDSAAIPATLVH